MVQGPATEVTHLLKSTSSVYTVVTHSWTKLHTQIMSWVSGAYDCRLCTPLRWSDFNNRPYLWPACCWSSVAVQTKSKLPCFNFSHLHFGSLTLHSGCSLHLLSMRHSKLRKILKICSIWPQENRHTHTCLQCSSASVGLTQAHPITCLNTHEFTSVLLFTQPTTIHPNYKHFQRGLHMCPM